MRVSRIILSALYILALPLTFPLARLVPKTSLILLYCSSRHRYSDNTRYLFEYMISNSSLDVCWVTDNAEIAKYITEKGGRYISTRRPLGMIWALLRARVMVDSGDGKFDPFWITSMSGTTLVTTLHGCGPKVTLSRDTVGKSAIKQMQNLLRFDHVNFPSDYAGEWIGGRIYNLPNEKIINLGYPRCDQLIEAKSFPVGQRPRHISKKFAPAITAKSTVILYTPTWRTYDYQLPLMEMPGLALEDLDQMLAEHDAYLFLTVHSVNVPRFIPDNQSRFCFISTDAAPLFDVSALMTEVDILVNDYATTSVDFAHTGRPQIAYMPDYERYKKAKGFAEEYRETLLGPEVTNFDGFRQAVHDAITNPAEVAAEYDEARQLLLEKYNKPEEQPSSLRWCQFLENLCR